MVIALLLSPFATGSSLAASGGGIMSVALAGVMILALAGSWAALQIVNRGGEFSCMTSGREGSRLFGNVSFQDRGQSA